MVICLERGADVHMAQLMPLPLTVSCFSKIQIGFTVLVPAHPGSPGKKPLNGCVCEWFQIEQSEHSRREKLSCVRPSIRLSLDPSVPTGRRMQLLRVCCCGPGPLRPPTAARTYLRLLQTISENSFIWLPKRLVTLLNLLALQK